MGVQIKSIFKQSIHRQSQNKQACFKFFYLCSKHQYYDFSVDLENWKLHSQL